MFSFNNKSKYKIDNSSSNNVIKQTASPIDNLLKQIRLKNKTIKEKIEYQAASKRRNEYRQVESKKIDINMILGRKVGDLSRNKFKFVKKRRSGGGFVGQTMKLDNRVRVAPKRSRIVLSPFIFMKRFHNTSPSYSVQKVKKTNVISIKGVEYNLNKNGKKLKVIPINRFKLDNQKKSAKIGHSVLRKYIARWVLL